MSTRPTVCCRGPASKRHLLDFALGHRDDSLRLSPMGAYASKLAAAKANREILASALGIIYRHNLADLSRDQAHDSEGRRTTIRPLRVTCVSWSGALTCELQAFTLAETPNYRALTDRWATDLMSKKLGLTGRLASYTTHLHRLGCCIAVFCKILPCIVALGRCYLHKPILGPREGPPDRLDERGVPDCGGCARLIGSGP